MRKNGWIWRGSCKSEFEIRHIWHQLGKRNSGHWGFTIWWQNPLPSSLHRSNHEVWTQTMGKNPWCMLGSSVHLLIMEHFQHHLAAEVCYSMEGKDSPYGVENTNQAFWLTPEGHITQWGPVDSSFTNLCLDGAQPPKMLGMQAMWEKCFTAFYRVSHIESPQSFEVSAKFSKISMVLVLTCFDVLGLVFEIWIWYVLMSCFICFFRGLNASSFLLPPFTQDSAAAPARAVHRGRATTHSLEQGGRPRAPGNALGQKGADQRREFPKFGRFFFLLGRVFSKSWWKRHLKQNLSWSILEICGPAAKNDPTMTPKKLDADGQRLFGHLFWLRHRGVVIDRRGHATGRCPCFLAIRRCFTTVWNHLKPQFG